MAKPAPTDKLAAAFDALKQGRLAQAQKLARALAQERPRDARAQALLARVLAAADDVDGARAAVDRALAIDARSVPALIESAALARRSGDLDRAVADLGQLVELQPLFPGFHHDLGVLELERGNHGAARDALVRARGLAPNQPDTRFKLANLEYREGNWSQAAAEYKAAVALKPDLTEAWLNLGEALFKLARHADALAAFRRAAALDARSFKAFEGISRCLWEQKANMQDWLDAREAMSRIEGTAAAYTRLARDYGKASRFASARDAYLKATALDPDYLAARWGAMQAPRDLMYPDDAALATYREEWRAGLAWFEAHEYVPERVPEYVACVLQATNFYLHYLGEPFLDEQRRYARIIERMMALAAAQLPAADAAPRARDGRIRVGICSGFMRRHTVMKLFSALVTGLDRTRFELSLFYTADIDNEGTEPLRAHADFFLLGERSPSEWIPAIRARELDVLVFLDIGMHPMMQALAALRFAPRQYVLWGHPVTTGFSSIDAFLTSDAMELPDAQRFYHERLVRLPRLGCCFAPPDLAPVDPPELASDAPRIDVFFAQSAFKILPSFDDVLARIAERVPSVRFHLTPHPQLPVREALRERMARAFAARGLALDRHLGLNRFVTEAEFLGLARASAFSLDSIGWSGGNTTLEILWLDTPVLTLPGELMRSRHTAAMLTEIDLPELIARDVDDYVERAVRLATDAVWRESLRAKIRERKMRLYDDRGVVEAFANVLAGDA
jgi:protein O-GlcNAc transferase